MEVNWMIFDRVKLAIVDQLGGSPDRITLETHFIKDLQADSLDAAEIIIALEDEYGIEIPEEDAENFQVVADLVNYVEAKVAAL